MAAYMDLTSVGTVRGVAAALLGLMLATYATTTVRFHLSRRDKSGKVAVAPYWIPGARHLFSFIWDVSGFPLYLANRYGWEKPIKFKLGNVGFTVLSNPDLIQALFKNHRHLTARSTTATVASNLLYASPSVVDLYAADDSGINTQPRPGSNVAHENRILYHQVRTHQKFLSSPHLEPWNQRYIERLRRGIERLNIGDEWVGHADLYKFLQLLITRANIESDQGEKLLEFNPDFIEEFWQAKSYGYQYFFGWPRWTMPSAYAVRDRVINTIKKWHAYGLENGDCTSTGPNDPEWEPILGSKNTKARLHYLVGMKAMDAHSRAAEDWGSVFGTNGNTVPSMFWYMYEVLKDPQLLSRLTQEAAPFVSEEGAINFVDLAEQPLLQSVFAEVLRMRTSGLTNRMAEYGDVKYNEYTVPQNEFILIHSDALHYNKEIWERAGRTITTPMTQFQADRFLVPSPAGPVYSIDGLSGIWVPFGGGDRMCPGRHLLKYQMLSTFAYIFTNFDIEMDSRQAQKVKCNRKFSPFGALPPDRPLGFKIRRKMKA
jgi:cytochrome P450